MVYNRIKVGRLGRRRRKGSVFLRFCLANVLMDVRERSWLGKVGNHAGLVAARGGNQRIEWPIVVSGSMETGSTRVNSMVGWTVGSGSILVTRGIADNLVRSLSTFVR